jgi:type I restriction enzyme, S subunit
MRQETFFEKFDQFADAPDAAAKMREMLLRLAVTGRLVPQDPGDEPASALLGAVEAERSRRISAGEIRARTVVPLEHDESPFELPPSWAWTRLAQVGYELGQKIPDRRFTYIDVGAIDSDRGRISDRVETIEAKDAPSRARKLVARGTVIYSTVRPYLLNVAIVERDFDPEPIASTAFGILHPFVGIASRYLFYWLRSAPFTNYVQAAMKGMAYPAINDEKFYNGLIPIPPEAEQKRIAAKVDELMALCDELEGQQQERQTRRAALRRAASARFSAAPTPANLGFLFHDVYTVEPADLRKTILSLASKGQLLQCPGGTPMWPKVTLREASLLITDGEHFTPERTASGVPLATAKNVRDGFLDLTVTDFVSRATAEKCWQRCKPHDQDILMVCVGATTGRVCLVQDPPEIVLVRSVALIRPNPERITSSFLDVFLRSPDGQAQVWNGVKQSAQPCLYLGRMAEFEIALPPLSEQRRIVAKVDELMSLLEEWDTQLAASRAAATNLLEAVLAELTTQA